MDFSDIELVEYGKYMDYIFNMIVEETRIKFGLKIERTQINLGHIDNVVENKPLKWRFYYTIKNDYKSEFEIWKGTPKKSCMTTQISYDGWKLELVKQNREEKLKLLGI